MIDEVQKEVALILDHDNSGHGMEHINRVLNMALDFADKENANSEVVALIALLHDVDDYKIVGVEAANNLTNTKRILNKLVPDENIKAQVLEEVSTIGYSKRIGGVMPKTIEGMVVSDADMCDAVGAMGIIRSYAYNMAHGNPFFDKDFFPVLEIDADTYIKNTKGTVVNHMFEKVLRLKKLMLTDSGKEEIKKRHEFVVKFLYEYFSEEKLDNWKELLDNYLKEEEE